MPTYEYECRSCGAGFDVFQSMSDAPLTVCPSCGQSVRRKINGGTGIIFKGSGFYKNDSKNSPPTTKSEPPRDKTARDASAGEKDPAKPERAVSATAASAGDAPGKDAT